MIRALWRVAAVLLAATAAAADPCDSRHLQIEGPWGQARFAVEIADTAETRARGLMHVAQMGRFEGMLFVYDAPQPVAFWMKNTLIPLDMLFADSEGQITRIHHSARPHDLTGIPGGDAVQFVLEINGGLARQLGLAPGDRLSHPAIRRADSSPCAAQ